MSNLPSPVRPRETALSRTQTEKVERLAVGLYGTIQQTSVQFAAQLRRLQDANAHLLRGYPSFGTYCERTFEGLTAVNAGQLSRQGNVLLILERTGRISLEGKGESLPGTTGVRNLAVILKRFGEEAMLGIYDEAIRTDRKVTAETITAATAQLIRPEPLELEAGEDQVEEEEEVDANGDSEHSEKVRELIDRIRDLSWELPESMNELSEATEQLGREIAKESTEADEQWLGESR